MSCTSKQGARPVLESVSHYAHRAFSYRMTIVIVLVSAALLRTWHIFQLRPLPLFDHLLLDSAFYDQWAQKISSGDWLGGQRAFYMDPLYPYLLALFYRCFGHDLLLVRLFQAGLGVATCALVANIGNRVGGRTVGTAAALLMALYGPAIYNECEIEKTAAGLFLVTAALSLAIRMSPASKIGAGICIALATLTRANLILMIPLAALYFLSDPGENIRNAGSGRISDWVANIRGKQVRNVMAFVLGCALIFSPVLWRNHHVSGEWILTTSQAGTNFYMGNNPENASGGYWPLSFVRANPQYEEVDFRREAEVRLGRTLSPREVSSFWFNESVRHIRENPIFAIKMFMAKFLLFWSNDELPDGWGMDFLSRYSVVLRLPLMNMGWLLPFAFLGAITSFKRSRTVQLLVGFVFVYSTSVIIFFLFSRYRLHVVPPLAVLAALGVQWLWQRLRERDLHRVAAGSITIILVGMFSFFGVQSVASAHTKWSQNHIDLALLYEDRGEYGNALSLLSEALQLEPGQLYALCSIGRVKQKNGDFSGSLDPLNKCAELDNDFPEIWYLLGTSYESLGQIRDAQRCYRMQLEHIPGHQTSILRLKALERTTAAGM